MLPHHDSHGGDPRAAQRADYAPLLIARPAPPDLQPLQIVPDNRRQRQRTVKRGIALLLTLAIIAVFLATLFLSGDRRADTPMQALMIVSGLLTIVALGAWVNFGVWRARKRTRRQRWQMSAS